MGRADKATYGKYHTAVGKYETKTSKSLDGIYRSQLVTSFVWDVCNGMNEEFKSANCIFVEPSWMKGYHKFTNGTIAENSTFRQYLNGIQSIIKSLKVPTFLLCGKQVCQMLKPDFTMQIYFLYHDYITEMAIWNVKENLPFQNEVQARDYISQKYDYILDFSCGYGSIADPAIQKGKHVILSDINTDCIEYIINKYKLIRS